MNFVDIWFVMFSLNVLLICVSTSNESENTEETTIFPASYEDNEVNAESFVNATGTQNEITVDQIGPIITQLLSPISSSIQPYLGPLAPLSNVLSQVISSTVAEVVVSILNDTISSVRRQETQFKNYTTYLVIIALSKRDCRICGVLNKLLAKRLNYRNRCMLKHNMNLKTAQKYYEFRTLSI